MKLLKSQLITIHGKYSNFIAAAIFTVLALSTKININYVDIINSVRDLIVHKSS